MRRSARLQHARGLGPRDHVCWSYTGIAEFRTRAAEFLADGLDAGCRVCYIRPGTVGDIAEDLRELAGWSEALRDGRAEVISLSELHDADAVLDPSGQVQAYAEATERAVADGFRGLRVAVDCTSLVNDAPRLAVFARFEHLIDRYMAGHPFSALCGYDRSAVEAEVLAELACLHPCTDARAAGFRLYAPLSAGHTVALAGELDLSTRDLLAPTLKRIDLKPEGGEVVLDASGVEFMDHVSVTRLADWAAARDADLVIRTQWSGIDRVIRLLDISNVRAEQLP
ncbi:MEDS domain-containing protein [Nocardia cerradoensis]|uniref:MEDS domain-containing protein n=1 Tax=Nocardia cerradoensis TaxID=85688 RepID=UPI001CB9028A|nr:MEDS domain-containing protein [Nocardia cerradoensis]